MQYQVVSADETSVTLWDRFTRDPDHPQERAGLFTLVVGAPNPFAEGDRVELAIKKLN